MAFFTATVRADELENPPRGIAPVDAIRRPRNRFMPSRCWTRSPSGPRRNVRIEAMALQISENGRRMLAGKNLVVFVITTFNIDKFSWGFDRLVEQLYGDPDAVAAGPEIADEEIEANLGD